MWCKSKKITNSNKQKNNVWNWHKQEISKTKNKCRDIGKLGENPGSANWISLFSFWSFSEYKKLHFKDLT